MGNLSPLPFSLPYQESLMVFYSIRFSHFAFRKPTPPSFLTRPPQPHSCPIGHWGQNLSAGESAGATRSLCNRGGLRAPQTGSGHAAVWWRHPPSAWFLTWYTSCHPRFLLVMTFSWSLKTRITLETPWEEDSSFSQGNDRSLLGVRLASGKYRGYQQILKQ